MKKDPKRSFELTLILCLLSVAIILAWGGHVYADDALFIDENGKVMVRNLEVTGRVGIGTDKPAAALDVNGKMNALEVDIERTVKAKKFEGDGSELQVDGDGNLREVLDKKLDKVGGTITGPLTINGKVTAHDFNICYCVQCKQDRKKADEQCARFGEWTGYSFPPMGNKHFESGCRIKLYLCQDKQ